MSQPLATRRRFLTGLLAAAAASALPALPAGAADAPRIPEDDPTAKALGYVLNAAKAEKDPAFKKGSTCANCTLYVAAQEKGGYAPCGAFGGKLVAKAGWCRAWAAKPA